jgi:4-hydroxy-tetrahydrodipicolinate reductase
MGVGGRMGNALVRYLHQMPNCSITGGTEPEGSPLLGADIGEVAGIGRLGIPITRDPLELFVRSEGVLDFTSTEATAEHATLAAQARIVHVIGTTGLSHEQEERVQAAGRHAVIIKSGNMSLGVNLLAALVRKAAAMLDADFDVEILEMHHRMKVDAPSGTAFLLGEAVAQGRDIALSAHSMRARDGHTGVRKRGDIGFVSLRGGDVVGDHTVIFAAAGERLEFTHRASDRQIYARGAVAAALWGRGKPPGIYSMEDVLGF